jgi:hypothetical protein
MDVDIFYVMSLMWFDCGVNVVVGVMGRDACGGG